MQLPALLGRAANELRLRGSLSLPFPISRSFFYCQKQTSWSDDNPVPNLSHAANCLSEVCRAALLDPFLAPQLTKNFLLQWRRNAQLCRATQCSKATTRGTVTPFTARYELPPTARVESNLTSLLQGLGAHTSDRCSCHGAKPSIAGRPDWCGEPLSR